MNALTNLRNSLYIALCIAALYCTAGAQNSSPLNIMFYNVENYFDTRDDSLTNDAEFLPSGPRRWTYGRFEKKRNDIAKVILAACDDNAPAIVGLAEIENLFVLEELTLNSPLRPLNYKIIHKESPDERGIDVALLYRPELVTPLRYNFLSLKQKGYSGKTREILYARFRTVDGDTLHVYFNHWPSRYRGQTQTDPLRKIAANVLRNHVLQMQNNFRNPKIVIMGDFNDEPQNHSIRDVLLQGSGLVNLSANWAPAGTLKYRQRWQIFDQIIISQTLLDADAALHTTPKQASIVNKDFLLEADPKYKGQRLYRTYIGYKYYGGISDHLPVRLELTNNR
ncbi:MAG: endonuclease [Bacteroidales bacterium]|jgi:predicted extracellular nuclease|nr:endonuclease [Bacteroidales bacterium]